MESPRAELQIIIASQTFLLVWLEKKEAEPLAGPRGNGSRPVLSPLPGRFLASYLSSRHPHPPNVPTGRRTFSSFRLLAPHPGLAGPASNLQPVCLPPAGLLTFLPKELPPSCRPQVAPCTCYPDTRCRSRGAISFMQ